MQAEKKLTGYPSIDKPWLKYYKPEAEERATNIPEGKTVWDVIEEKLLEYKDIPAIEYFGRTISRLEFIDLVYTWARAFKALGIRENEVIPYYGPFFPDVGAMAFAFNLIGACPYFLKLAISPEALAEETKDSRFAIVFDDMWPNVSGEFSKERFEKVIIISALDAMPSPQKQIVSLIRKLKRDPNTPKVPRGEKYLRLAEAKKHAARFHREVKAAFVSDRAAFITSSSGTALDGIVKGVVATNEVSISLIYSEIASGQAELTELGDRVLNHFPPTAATSLLSLFLMPLYCGETIIMDPRISEKDFYSQIMNYKPNLVLTTGSAWEAFFNTIKEKKDYDFDFAKEWIVGGEGTDIAKIIEWNKMIQKAGGEALFSGYGQSEHFSTVTVETKKARYDFSKPVMSVGIPLAGLNVGVFADNGKEKQ